MIILELNGLPGCGKTTIINEIIDNFRKADMNVKSLDEVIKYKQKEIETKITQLICSFFTMKNLKFNFYIIILMFKIGLSLDRVRFSMRLIKLNYQIGRIKKSEKVDLMILDEGYIQFITSIPHNKQFNDGKTLRNICQFIENEHPDLRLVNCKISTEIAINRAQNRSSSSSRFDKLDTNKLSKLMIIKQNNLERIQNQFSEEIQTNIRLEEDIETNTRVFKNHILRLLISSTK